MELAEVAALEFNLVDKVYYGVVKDSWLEKATYLSCYANADPSNVFVPVFSSIEKVMAHMFWRGYKAQESFVQEVGREDGEGFALGVAGAGYTGFLFDPPLNSEEDVVFFGFEQMRAWANAKD